MTSFRKDYWLFVETFGKKQNPSNPFVYTGGMGNGREMPGIHKNLGMIYSRIKPDPERAVFYFQDYLKLQPNDPEAPQIRSVIADLKKRLGWSRARDLESRISVAGLSLGKKYRRFYQVFGSETVMQ